ncbi:hypothetical protein EWM64_g910 [Hericium alpestre]|uniref:AA9 family lytic polysaccharide monooxygenase n=1 Tax=Hericium alpestre TaxID=135208 RepID=A0A4Z0A7P5_9AGAM|nr:hypothetical protein EWM64_g910 [Hericium alpestre]
MKSTFASLASLVVLASSAFANTVFSSMSVNGVPQGQGVGIRVPSANSPITDVTSDDIICNTGFLQPVSQAVIPVPAGGSVTANFHHRSAGYTGPDPADPIDPTDKGPLTAYLAAVPEATQSTVTGLQWFKIWEDGLSASGQWASDRLFINNGSATFTIPSCIQSGQYLLRVEDIALQDASSYPGAQFFMSCAQIEVSSGGTDSPATVSFPGAYTPTSPGIVTDIYGISSYTVPDQQSVSYTVSTRPSQSKEHLRSIWASLTPPLSQTRINDTINALQQYESSQARIAGVQAADEEEKSLKIAIAGRLVVGLYAEALDTFLKEASEAESEAEWWADIERSSLSVAYYLLQTLPARLLNLAHTIFSAIQSQNRAFNTSAFAITSLRGFFSGTNIGHPNSLAALLFPHLHRHPHAMPLSFASFKISAFSLQPPPLFPSTSDVVSGMNTLSGALTDFYYSLLAAVALPVELTRQEVKVKRQELQHIRDERAEVLGELVDKREQLERALLDEKSGSADERQLSFLHELDQTIADRAGDATLTGPPPSLVATLAYVSSTLLPQHTADHAEHLRTHGLLKPSRLVLLWPRLVLLPPLGLYAIKQLYASQDSLIAMGQDAWATVKGFWRGWLVEPMKDMVKTVRAGGDEGMIVSKESVDADLQSLERMALDLAREKLHYSPTQLNELSAKIRVGDLTPILQIYEDDIKSPVRSAIGGTLLRSLFVQVQKAKVDIDQALAGIDKLLKSQELTFAFVGVAPALAIVYVTGGNEALRKHGILPPLEPKPRTPSPPPSPSLDDIVDDFTPAELQELAEDVKDDELERYVLQMRDMHLAELKREQARGRFGEVIPIGREDYTREVTEASEVDQEDDEKELGTPVVLFLYKDGIPRSDLTFVHVRTLAKRYPSTKFVSIVGDKCIENLPDTRIPTFICYKKGKIICQVVSWGADREHKMEELEALLIMHGAIDPPERVPGGRSASRDRDSEEEEDDDDDDAHMRSATMKTNRTTKNIRDAAKTDADSDSDFDL